MAAPPAIDPREGLRPLFERAGIGDDFYHRYKERLLDKGVGNAGDLLEEVALKGIASLGIHERQAEKLRRALLGRRGWEDAAAVLAASFGGLSLDDTPAGVAAGDQAAGGAASAPAQRSRRHGRRWRLRERRRGCRACRRLARSSFRLQNGAGLLSQRCWYERCC